MHLSVNKYWNQYSVGAAVTSHAKFWKVLLLEKMCIYKHTYSLHTINFSRLPTEDLNIFKKLAL